MGQYYKPVNVDKKEWLDCYEHDSLAKLMEHSWIGNNFVNTVVLLLTEGQPWHKTRMIWTGDYAETSKLIHPSTKRACEIHTRKKYPQYYGNGEPVIVNLFDLCLTKEEATEKPYVNFTYYSKIKPEEPTDLIKNVWFIINHTKKEFVDLRKCSKESDGWQIHPLPLLTCDSFGGGGSFHPENDYKGVWVGDIISASAIRPEGYKEIVPNFTEE